ncbi:MAG: DMT family transporter [Alphaproteobacteria bacterium]|nr:DMT family transporter [Alphaproteobacteria bacterium]
MALCSLCFAALNASTRTITADLHPWQTQCLRYAFGALVLLPLALRQGRGLFRTGQLRLHMARNLLHTAGTSLWFLALPIVPLAEVTAIGFTSPIFLTIGALLFFGETVRLRRWLAIFFGFLGVLIVLYPNLRLGLSASWASLLLLASAPIASLSYLIAKVLMRHDPPQTVVFWQGVLVAAFTFPLAIYFWGPMTLQHVALFLLIGALGSMGHYALNRSLRATDISASQPARFLELIWASALGFLIWQDVPPVWTFVGAMVIFSSTTYIAHREARLARQAKEDGLRPGAKSP